MSLLQVTDCLLLAMVLGFVWAPVYQGGAGEFLPVLLVLPGWLFLLRYFGIYESQRLEGVAGLIRKILSVQVTGATTGAAALWICGQASRLPQLGLFAGVGLLVLICERASLYLILHILRRRGFDLRQVCVIGPWEAASGAHQRFSGNPEWGLRVTCVGLGTGADRRYVGFPGGEVISPSLEEVLRTQVIDEIMIVLPPEELAGEKSTLSLCEAHGVIGRILIQSASPELAQRPMELFSGETTITIGRVPGDSPLALWKRMMDLLLGSAFLVVLSPVMLFSALLIKLSSPGPAIFKQRRAGQHARPFSMLKFRTMVDGAENMLRAVASRSITSGPVFKDPTDVRITPIGHFLRRFSIDELPQLLNVLRGEMSLVGPRPLPLHEANCVSGVHRRRFSMRPGITCLWQVNGRSDVTFAEWMRYDLQYVDSWSLWLDLKLLVRTIPAVLSGRGAY